MTTWMREVTETQVSWTFFLPSQSFLPSQYFGHATWTFILQSLPSREPLTAYSPAIVAIDSTNELSKMKNKTML